MHLLTQSTLLRVLGWTLFNSLWQMGLLWFLYLGLTRIFSITSARTRHGLTLLLLGTGTLWSTASFLTAWLGGAAPLPGNWIPAGLLEEGMSYGSPLYFTIL